MIIAAEAGERRSVLGLVVQKNPVPADAASMADQTFRPTSPHSRGRNPEILRLVHYWNPETCKE
jgi:hypothetical protein